MTKINRFKKFDKKELYEIKSGFRLRLKDFGEILINVYGKSEDEVIDEFGNLIIPYSNQFTMITKLLKEVYGALLYEKLESHNVY